MELLNHKIIFIEEFFGSRIYNTQKEELYVFDKLTTERIKRIYSGNSNNTTSYIEIKKDLFNKGLLTSDISYIQHKVCNGLFSPLRVSMNITRNCNLLCLHCLSDSGDVTSDELTTQELFGLVDQMRKSGSFYLAIGGGEPLLRKDLFDIIGYARNNYITVTVVTNGLLVTDETAQKLDDLKIKSVTVSIDGREINHDLNRGEGNFRKSIEKIKVLRKHLKYPQLAMRVIINSFNINDVDYLVKLADRLNLDSIRLTPILPFGRATEHPEMFITQGQYINFLETVQNTHAKIQVIFPNQVNESNLLIDHSNWGCHCGKETCWVTETGDFYPCIFLGKDYMAGNIRKHDFNELWVRSKEILTLNGNDTCKTCKNYNNCRGGCRCRALVTYGDINAIDPLCPNKRNIND